MDNETLIKRIENQRTELTRLSKRLRSAEDSRNHWKAEAKRFVNLLHEAIQAKPQWISVEERVPTEEEYRDEYGELIPILVCEKDTVYPYRAMYDGVNWGDGLSVISSITHWMPLPEPPK